MKWKICHFKLVQKNIKHKRSLNMYRIESEQSIDINEVRKERSEKGKAACKELVG